jgi:hypothetical protein
MIARALFRAGARAARCGALVAACAALPSCGYHAVYASGEGARLHVKLVRSLVPDAMAADEVVSGVREELALSGALAAGEGYPRVEIEVLRLDETSEGIAAPRGATAPLPRARATDVAVVARAWIASLPDAPIEHDTGDMRSTGVVSVAADARSDMLQHDDATRATSRRMGHKLALKVLGHPVTAEE